MAHPCHCHQNPPKSREQQQLARRTLGIIARSFEMLEDGRIPPRWLPRITNVRHTGDMLTGHVPEYGCGAYGCVFPTLDPNVVLKVTEDDTEAEFAGNWSARIAKPITVIYHDVLAIDPSFTKYPTYLMWREAAAHVGDLQTMVAQGDLAYRLVDRQHEAAQRAYTMISDPTADTTTEDITEALDLWMATCESMAAQHDVPELQEVGAGMLEVYRENKVFFGDIHIGNLGLVTRSGVDHWVITDPGHVAVIDI